MIRNKDNYEIHSLMSDRLLSSLDSGDLLMIRAHEICLSFIERNPCKINSIGFAHFVYLADLDLNQESADLIRGLSGMAVVVIVGILVFVRCLAEFYV